MSQKRIKNVQMPRNLGVTDADAAAIIAARAKAVVDRVVGECMVQVKQKPRTLREARLVKKFEVRVNG